MSDGEVRRGHSELTGEIAHLTVARVDGRAVTFTDILQQLGLRRARSTAIDVEALLAAVAGGLDGPSLVETLAAAVGDITTSAIAFCDPRLNVGGGRWGTAALGFDTVQTAPQRSPDPSGSTSPQPAATVHSPEPVRPP